MTKQVGRNVFNVSSRSKYDTKLSWIRSIKKRYYTFRISLFERQTRKYGMYPDYRMELCNAAIHNKQAYLYKIEALYSLQELKDYKRRVKRDVREGRASKIKPVKREENNKG